MGHHQPPGIKITLTIEPSLLEQIDNIASEQHTKRSEIIRQALREYLSMAKLLTGEPDLETAFKILQRRRALATFNKIQRGGQA